MADNPNFDGLRVGAFESRHSDLLAQMIQKSGGVPFVSPSMREIPLESNSKTIEFARDLMTGHIDAMIFLTGVGFRYLLQSVEKEFGKEHFLDMLRDLTTIARGPKPTAAMREVGLQPTLRVPAPNTWRETLGLIDDKMAIANLTIAIQEYGQPNPSLIAGLEARGAKVFQVPVYKWALPEDKAPIEENVRRIIKGQLDVLMFTSANQVTNLMQVANELVANELGASGFKDAIKKPVIVSIGPTTSERLRNDGIPVDIEPAISKMGQMVQAAARHSATTIVRKQNIKQLFSGPFLDVNDPQAPWYNSPFMKACRREPTDVTPIWMMRQAGRYMSEYREVRNKTTFLELCKNPQLCSEIMCTAVERLGVDAAIIFSDLLPILEPMGLDLEFAKGEGPVIHNPIRESSDLDRIFELESIDSLHFVTETVRQTRADLPEDMPLIGFSGAPFTLASYAIEGGSSKNYLHTKTLMYRDEGAWKVLMERFARAITLYLNAQIAAGAQCVQLFDSWVGCLGTADYRKYVLPYILQIIRGITPGVPIINFGTGNPALLPLYAESGASVIGVDWRIDLDVAWKQIGYDRAVQGNFEPLALLAEPAQIRERAEVILKQAGGRPGHIFNLGHGIIPQTPVENAIALVDAVHELSSR